MRAIPRASASGVDAPITVTVETGTKQVIVDRPDPGFHIAGVGGMGLDEVAIDTVMPTKPTLELWYDPAAVAAPTTEVYVQDTDPAPVGIAYLWVDTSTAVPGP